MRNPPVDPDPVIADGESVWDYPRPPRAEPIDAHIVIELGGVTIAETRSAIRTLKTSRPPTYYLPPGAFIAGTLVASGGESFCEWKGIARYFDILAADQRRVRAAWAYPEPTAAFDLLRDHVAVYAAEMDACFVDGEKVTPQPGDFYGGWITERIAGPFKGIAGRRFW